MSAQLAEGAAKVRAAHVWERDELDWYVEESRAASGLLKVERFGGRVWDPSCGQGNIIEAFLAAGYEAIGSDIKRRTDARWFVGERDFLTSEDEPLAVNIVGNPPFFRAKGTEAFIRQATKLARGKVAMFTDIKFLAGDGRATGLFADLPPTRIWSMSPRISCPPGEYLMAGNVAGGGTADWVWLVWDMTAPRRTTEFGWVRCPREVAA